MIGTKLINNLGMSIKDMMDNMDQHKAWEMILGMSIPRFTIKSILFRSPFREDRHPGCCLAWYKGRIVFLDSADATRHGADCVAVYSQMSSKNAYEATLELLDGNTSCEVQKMVDYKKGKGYGFSMGYKKRGWNTDDYQFFKKIGVSIEQAKGEDWIAIRSLRYNSRHDPSLFSESKADAYIIKVGKFHKYYNPGGTPKFLSTVPRGTVAGNSTLIEELPLIINKGAKDHLVVSQTHNSRYIVNGEGDMPSVSFIEAHAHFPMIIFLYDNDEAGLALSQKAADYFNRVTGNENAYAAYLPDDAKDPSDWVALGMDIQKEIEKIIDDVKQHKRRLDEFASADPQRSPMWKPDQPAQQQAADLSREEPGI